MKLGAFTLTELLVVVLILAVLASLVVAILPSAIREAKVGEVTANASQIIKATHLYAADFDDFPPYARSDPASDCGLSTSVTFDALLYPYTKSWAVFGHPLDSSPPAQHPDPSRTMKLSYNYDCTRIASRWPLSRPGPKGPTTLLYTQSLDPGRVNEDGGGPVICGKTDGSVGRTNWRACTTDLVEVYTDFGSNPQ